MPDKHLSVHIWMDNQTGAPQSYFDVCSVTFASHIDLYDSSGRRVPPKYELTLEKHGGLGVGNNEVENLEECGCCILLSVPPHSLSVVDHGDLSLIWTLPWGNYTIIERQSSAHDAAVSPAATPALPHSGPRLSISVP